MKKIPLPENRAELEMACTGLVLLIQVARSGFPIDNKKYVKSCRALASAFIDEFYETPK